MRKLLLIGWDAADWKVIHPLLDKGEMPNLARLIEGGMMGDITTLEPVLSPMLWNSIATGKYADQHGILGFTEVDPEQKRVRPVTSTSRHCKAIWNILMQNGYRTHVIHWFGGHPAEPISGICVSDAFSRGYRGPVENWPLIPGSVHPPELADTLAEFRVCPEEIDEQMLTLFVPDAASIDQDADHRLATLAKIQAECLTVHSAATFAMEKHPWDFMGIYYPSIDHFSHAFMNFHPPRMEWVDEKQFAFYKDVVNSGYRLHDLFLGRLLELAPPDTTVILCSDHGFHSDHLRPREIPNIPAGPAEQHRPLGILVMRGPGIKKDEILYGATLLDIAPTILNLCGLPAAQDMSGRALLEAMEDPKPVPRIPSWEAVEGQAGMHQGYIAMADEDADALIEQFVALGYIDKPDEDQHKAVVRCERERMWNLARVYLHSKRPNLALPVLEEIWDQSPDRIDYGLELAHCQSLLGMTVEAQATALEAVEQNPQSPGHHAVLANIAVGANRFEEALAHLQEASKGESGTPGFPLRLASVYLRMRRWDDAEAPLLLALELDPHNAAACELLALAHLRRKRWREAAAAALDGVGFEHHRPVTHLYLGIALFKLEQFDRAIRAFETALSFWPPLRQAHFWMARVLWRMAGRQEEAIRHRALAREARAHRLDRRDRMQRLKAEAGARAGERGRKRASRKAEIAIEREAAEVKRKNQMEQRAAAAEARKNHPSHALDLLLVSGLPRSGTSVMMQMLAAAGVPVMTDGQRLPDSDNPNGYLEWEAIKKLPGEPWILYEAEGKATKVISMLLSHLPVKHRYKVVFMDRPIEEVAVSHAKMIKNRGEKQPGADPERIKQTLEQHRRSVLRGMAKSPAFEVLVVDYPSLVREPASWVEKIVAFLGRDRVPRPEAMTAVIDPSLHRNRLEPSPLAVREDMP